MNSQCSYEALSGPPAAQLAAPHGQARPAAAEQTLILQNAVTVRIKRIKPMEPIQILQNAETVPIKQKKQSWHTLELRPEDPWPSSPRPCQDWVFLFFFVQFQHFATFGLASLVFLVQLHKVSLCYLIPPDLKQRALTAAACSQAA